MLVMLGLTSLLLPGCRIWERMFDNMVGCRSCGSSQYTLLWPGTAAYIYIYIRPLGCWHWREKAHLPQLRS